MVKKMIIMVVLCCALFSLTGCSTLVKGTPATGSVLDYGSMKRGDYEVLDRVSGESECVSILFGLIQINDGNLKLFGLPFYVQKFAYYQAGFFGGFGDNAVNRAYFNALAKTPDADNVLQKSVNVQTSGIPGLFETEKVTFEGKAVRIKTDKDVK